MNNPFSLTFGKEPDSYIKRPADYSEITGAFEGSNPSQQCFIITGVRGSGKTVFLSQVSDYYKKNENWIVVDLNPERDMLESLAAKIYDMVNLKHLFLKAEFSFSFHGLTLSLHGENPVSDIESLLDRMMAALKKRGIRVLITVDEATSNSYMRVFAHTFQGFMRDGYPVFLLMTGLYQNILDLQNEKTLTFLYRAPKIFLSSLNLPAISDSFENILHLSHQTAVEAAKLTRGYAFAYQTLGYLLFEREDKMISKELLSEYDLYLSDNVYEKIYSEFSKESKRFLLAVAESSAKESGVIEKSLGFTHGKFSVYRKKMIDQGILNGENRGFLSFSLPRFEEFLLRAKEFE